MKNKSKLKTSKFSILVLVFLLVPVVFVSGCAEGGNVFSIFSSIFEQKETVVASPDVLLVKEEHVIPEQPISANSHFSLIFQVVNVGDAEKGDKEARNVSVYAYDWGLCHPLDGSGNPIDTDYSSEIGGIANQPQPIYPGGAELVEFNFKAPTNSELGNMEGKCPIRYRVEYTFDAFTTSDIAIVPKERIIQASKAGEDITVSPIQTQSRGPLKISVDFDIKQPVSTGIIIPAIIKVRDEGSGMYEKVPQGMLKIEFPSDFEVLGCESVNWMGNSKSNTQTNSQGDIPLIKGETPSIRCSLRFKGTINDIKTYNVKAEIIGYEYPLYEEEEVTIKPTYMEEEWAEEMRGCPGCGCVPICSGTVNPSCCGECNPVYHEVCCCA